MKNTFFVLLLLFASPTAFAKMETEHPEKDSLAFYAKDYIPQKLEKLGIEVELPTIEYNASPTLMKPMRFTRTFDELGAFEVEVESDPIVIHTTPSQNPYVQRAHELFDKVTRENRLTDVLSSGDLVDLPIGINKEIDDKQYIIIIDSVAITPEAAYLTAYMSLPIPNSEQNLAFRGSNIRFTQSGGLTGDVKLELLEDLSFELSENAMISLKGDGSTFVEWDCYGFKSLGIGADIAFSRDYLRPDNADGSVGDGRVTAGFQTVVNDWSDLIVTMSLPAFQVKGLDGFGFTAENVVFDFSDLNNAANVVFPEGYESTLMTPDNPELWQGFYIRELSIRLPPQFTTKGSDERKVLTAQHMIIDNMGFTGMLSASGLINKKDGTMGGWKFSLDSIAVNIQANQVLQAGFNGVIEVPVFKEGKDFTYEASITPGQGDGNSEYFFAVTTQDKLEMSLWAAEAELHESSRIEILVENGKFKPKAILNGKMDINASLSDNSDGNGPKTQLAGIAFEQLEVSTVSPYVRILEGGSFSLGSEALQQKMAGFPLSIENVKLTNGGSNELSLDFDVIVSLTGKDGGAMGAAGSLSLVSEIQPDRFDFKRVDVHELNINVDQGAFALEGQLVLFKEDPTYGTGIKGVVEARFQPGIKVQASALFGAVDDYRYWYADALAEFNSGIVIVPGFAIYGFGGGAYYHMRQVGANENAGSEIGASPSGIVYVPDEETFLGIKAVVTMGVHPGKESFNGEAAFEIAFNKNGGVNMISFSGNAYFVTPPSTGLASLQKKAGMLASATGADFGDPKDKGQMSGRMLIQYDIPNQTLHGNLDVFINVAGGAVRGNKGGNLAGSAVLHFSPDEWYVRIGTPDSRIGLKVAGLFEMGSYFMMGTQVPDLPPVDPKVTEIISSVNRDFAVTPGMLGNGGGMAFGSSFSFDTGDMRFLMFYGRFAIGGGFDMLFKNYGSATSCAGRSGPVGINGWFAQGQAYGYFQGKVGIKVDLLFYQGDVEILSIGAAAVLQAQLPNPVWLKGTVGGYYSVLNGLVEGTCRFQVEVGQKCALQGSSSPLGGIQLIAQVTPSQGESEVDVFTNPQAILTFPLDKSVKIVDNNGRTKEYKMVLGEFKVTSSGQEIPGEVKLNAKKDVITFIPRDFLPGDEEIELTVTIDIKQKSAASWLDLIQQARPLKETQTIRFTTGPAPDFIPMQNIAYMYPLPDQRNFYKNESPEGYIQLIAGQSNILGKTPLWDKKIRFSTANGQRSEVDYTYNEGTKTITFPIPEDLANDRLYKINLVSIPLDQTTALDANVTENRQVSQLDEDNTLSVNVRKADRSLVTLQENSLLETHFRVSKYNTFREKVNALNEVSNYYFSVLVGIQQLGISVDGTEFFEGYELQQIGDQKPLMKVEALLENRWFNELIHPLVYKNYPYKGLRIIDRDESTLGVPPVRAVNINQWDEHELLTDTEKQSGLALSANRSASILYDIHLASYRDYIDLRRQAARRYQGSSDPWINDLLTKPFPSIRQDTYTLKLQYQLPGTDQPGTEARITFRPQIGGGE
ncbi:hypothetical protein FNH22_03855 [Fulvivirga sp. M361]|uniref:hypothetical protein n=1 Tax=Fulvivirga sp. M361 TaxID=2594266 RepID=UPI00117B28E4|nr:hypothetical protein [Fulvivirga sp. M361]TRX61200.1 hypothetical protein FNH22_03855 [Fulvivirga sp. M361]